MIKSSTATSRTAFRLAFPETRKSPLFMSVDHPLITKLAKDAPGTFNHCRRVANLMVAAAVGLNINLFDAWEAGLLHDISKAEHPDVFLESGHGERAKRQPIASLDELDLIINHAERSAQILTEAGFSNIVIEAVRQHHGTAICQARLIKELKEHKGRHYPGPVPASKLAALLMIADHFEAILNGRLSQSETVTKYEVEKLTADILNMVWQGMKEEEQLQSSGLMDSELPVLRKAFCSVLLTENLQSLPMKGQGMW